MAERLDDQSELYRAGTTKDGRRTWKRSTQAEMQARHDAIYDIVQESQPTGIRFAYYRATSRGLVPKDNRGYEHVQRAIKEMRDEGRMPWSWIVDNNRWMRKPTTFDDVEDALDALTSSYRKGLWQHADEIVEVWCESESVAGVLYPVTSKWDVPLYPIKGQTSDSFAYGAAQTYKYDERELVIYYLGDHDPHGYEIQTNLHLKLEQHSERDDIRFKRLACSASDVALLGLTGTTPKKSSYVDAFSKEHIPWTGDAVEIEAIDPNKLRELLSDALSSHIDAEALRLHKVAERSERDGLRWLKGEWRDGREGVPDDE